MNFVGENIISLGLSQNSCPHTQVNYPSSNHWLTEILCVVEDNLWLVIRHRGPRIHAERSSWEEQTNKIFKMPPESSGADIAL